MEMPGFSRQEQRCIAALVLGHRGRPTRDKIADVAPMWDRKLLHLVLLLRVAARPPTPFSAAATNHRQSEQAKAIARFSRWLACERPLPEWIWKKIHTLERLNNHRSVGTASACQQGEQAFADGRALRLLLMRRYWPSDLRPCVGVVIHGHIQASDMIPLHFRLRWGGHLRGD